MCAAHAHTSAYSNDKWFGCKMNTLCTVSERRMNFIPLLRFFHCSYQFEGCDSSKKKWTKNKMPTFVNASQFSIKWLKMLSKVCESKRYLRFSIL